MPTNVATVGKLTSAVEVANVSPHGFWLLLGDEELFVPFVSFPWFRSASIAQITRVEHPSSQHLYWPDLDIDLSVESIRNPEAFPLVAKIITGSRADFDKYMAAVPDVPPMPGDER